MWLAKTAILIVIVAESITETYSSTTFSTTSTIIPDFGQCGYFNATPNARIVGGVQATVTI